MSGPHPRGGGAPTRVRGATPLPSRLRRGRRRQAPHGDPQHRLGFLGRRGAVRGRRRAERRALGLALFRPGGRVAEFLADPSVLRDGRPVLAGGARGTAAGAAPAPARRAGPRPGFSGGGNPAPLGLPRLRPPHAARGRAGPGLRSRPAGRRGGPGAPGAPSGRGSGLLAGGGAGARRPRALGGDGPAPDRLGRGLAAGGGQSGGSPVASGGSGGAQRSTQATPSSARGGGRKKAVSPLGRKSAATSRPAEATARGAK